MKPKLFSSSEMMVLCAGIETRSMLVVEILQAKLTTLPLREETFYSNLVSILLKDYFLCYYLSLSA